MKLKKLGVWALLEILPAADAAGFAKRVEDWGYDALWIPEATGRDVASFSAWLLANTSSLVVASGIANIYARDDESSEGFGRRQQPRKASTSNPTADSCSDWAYLTYRWWKGFASTANGKPTPTKRAYLDAMAAAPYQSLRSSLSRVDA